MADEKILKEENLSDEELEKVAGGSARDDLEDFGEMIVRAFHWE